MSAKQAQARLLESVFKWTEPWQFRGQSVAGHLERAVRCQIASERDLLRKRGSDRTQIPSLSTALPHMRKMPVSPTHPNRQHVGGSQNHPRWRRDVGRCAIQWNYRITALQIGGYRCCGYVVSCLYALLTKSNVGLILHPCYISVFDMRRRKACLSR